MEERDRTAVDENRSAWAALLTRCDHLCDGSAWPRLRLPVVAVVSDTDTNTGTSDFGTLWGGLGLGTVVLFE